jgi:hypothetical protein
VTQADVANASKTSVQTVRVFEETDGRGVYHREKWAALRRQYDALERHASAEPHDAA